MMKSLITFKNMYKEKDINTIENLFIALILVICLVMLPIFLSRKKRSKSELAAYYQVDHKTLNKWVKYFAAGVFLDYSVYLKRRKLSVQEYTSLVDLFGDRELYPVLSKQNIIEQAEGSYRSLRESVRQYPHHFGLSRDAFHGLRKFPPRISKRILEQYS